MIDDSLLAMWKTAAREGLHDQTHFLRPIRDHSSQRLSVFSSLIDCAGSKLLHSGYTPRYGWPAIFFGFVLGSVYLVREIWLKPFSIYVLMALFIAYLAYQGC